ncbi:hypothetical protein [Streptococcus pluranimalium]|uniref:hypothetical protein n=1 Tax=Streptococcus pluranimalium TaxID=82348 RepID=UPI003F691982
MQPIVKESIRTLLPASNSIKEVSITVRNDGFQLSRLFPEVIGDQETLLQKLFGNMIEVSNELDINTTTVIFKKSRYKREMDIRKIDNILSLLNTNDQNLISAKVKFENPRTGVTDELDLKHEGYLTSEKSTGRLTGFDNLASLLTEHYYDDVNRQADDKFYGFGNLLPIQPSEISISLPD